MSAARDLWKGGLPVSAQPAQPAAGTEDDNDVRLLAFAVAYSSVHAAVEDRPESIVTLHRSGTLHFWSSEGRHQRAVRLQREILEAASVAANPRTQHVAISFTAYATLEIDHCLFDFDLRGAVCGLFDPQSRAQQLCFLPSPYDGQRDWLYALRVSDGLCVYDASSQYRSLLFRIGGRSGPSHTFVHSLHHAMKETLLAAHTQVTADQLASSKSDRAAVAVQLRLWDAELGAMACDRRTKQLYLFDANSQRWLVTDACGAVLRCWREERVEREDGSESKGELDRLHVAGVTLPAPHTSPSPSPTLFASYDVVRHSLLVVQLMQCAGGSECVLKLEYFS